MSTTLHTPMRGRTAIERELREQGYGALTPIDAPFTDYDRLLPECSIEQQIETTQKHGRLLWSHPGASGLDPRAVGPLALVRVADGLGPEPLDPPLNLSEAARWLLRGDVGSWLTRPRHRTTIRVDGEPCLWEGHGLCSTHPEWDEQLFELSEALGDPTPPCSVDVWPKSPSTGWAGVASNLESTDLPHVGYQALRVSKALGALHREDVHGSLAWELVRQGVSHASELAPVREIRLPPPAAKPDGRGMDWTWCWGMNKKGWGHLVITCQLCGAQSATQPCNTCTREGRTTVLSLEEWHNYLPLATLDLAFVAGDPGSAVACGHPTCPTPVSLSVTTNEGVRL